MRRSVIVVAIALGAAFLPLPSALVERWYSHGIYPVLQHGLTRASSLVPFALLDVAAIAAIVAWVAFVARRWRQRGGAAGLKAAATSLTLAASVLYLAFLALWGLNYRRVPLEAKLAYDPSHVTRDNAFRLGEIAVERVNALEPTKHSPVETQDRDLAKAFDEAQLQLDATRPALAAPPKRSLLSWYFRRAAIDGMTDPFFLEIIVNPDVLPIERPFVLAHEWAHLAGYADESEANFVAWLICLRADSAAQYSGWLAAYRLAALALPRDDRLQLQRRLGPAVVEDFRAIAARLQRANPATSRLARNVYDSYLKANRVEEGIDSYDAAVRLMVGTSFENGWVPKRRQ